MMNLSNIVSYSDVFTNSIAQLLDFPGDKNISNTSSETYPFRLIASLLVNETKKNRTAQHFMNDYRRGHHDICFINQSIQATTTVFIKCTSLASCRYISTNVLNVLIDMIYLVNIKLQCQEKIVVSFSKD